MPIPDVKERWTSKINEVTLGATKDQGGTRAKTVTVGGQTTLPFLTFEGDLPYKPVIAGFVADTVPDWPDFLTTAIGKEVNSPVEWAQKAVEEYGVDLISLKMVGADPAVNDASPEACAKVVEDVLKAVDVPLIIWGSGDDEKDNQILPECSQVARGENCLIGSAKESNYRTVVAICKADKHKIISEAPVDINIGKQVNILLQDAGYDLKDVVMFQTTAALGYGFDYVYTILERARIAGLKGDKLMAAPQICDVGGEVYRIKEAVVDDDILPGWGKVNKRGPAWEATCAAVYLQAGADILVMAHPDAIKDIQTTIERLL
ncbi:acetyl-CoA decarbonylase/synthase complex subunit delta [candidate division KSB3 bacterium]|uniref:Acetyl-CoA decarbonylase/synthase complex subunit delta n=1 Tax=candidate division KSB3 bacterium TaxID=2044937 RepID=A0A9D5JYS9_9BACT|nr:acetyl-CoA decarbonylase/synthase complex subunit delta [candidate division KSB3 bacterium]MBD3326613.1 acetyl-CoA decarbonylase/synthase complex subunit delta [candidate division KSB3 bacterium]